MTLDQIRTDLDEFEFSKHTGPRDLELGQQIVFQRMLLKLSNWNRTFKDMAEFGKRQAVCKNDKQKHSDVEGLELTWVCSGEVDRVGVVHVVQVGVGGHAQADGLRKPLLTEFSSQVLAANVVGQL